MLKNIQTRYLFLIIRKEKLNFASETGNLVHSIIRIRNLIVSPKTSNNSGFWSIKVNIGSQYSRFAFNKYPLVLTHTQYVVLSRIPDARITQIYLQKC